MQLFAIPPNAVAVSPILSSLRPVEQLETYADCASYYRVCIVEVKVVRGAVENSRTATGTGRPRPLRVLRQQLGTNVREDNDNLKRLLPDMSHRPQLIHHASANSCRHMLYTVSSTTTVLYCVLTKQRYRDTVLSRSVLVLQAPGHVHLDDGVRHGRLRRRVSALVTAPPGQPPKAEQISPRILSILTNVLAGSTLQRCTADTC
jgi:hypothetical protein